MNTSTYFSWSTEKTTIQLHISEPSFNSWFVSNTNTTVSMLTANRVSVCTENEKLLFSLHHISSPLSPPSDSSEADTPRMPHSCWAPCFSVSLAPTPTHWKVPPGVTRTKASLELSWDAAASSCVGAEMTQVNMCSSPTEVPLFVFPAVPVRIQSNSVHYYTIQEQILHLYFTFHACLISRLFSTFSRWFGCRWRWCVLATNQTVLCHIDAWLYGKTRIRYYIIHSLPNEIPQWNSGFLLSQWVSKI